MKTILKPLAIAAMSIVTSVLPAHAWDRPTVPVLIYADADDDTGPCASGTVEGLNPHGDGFLAVKAGPGANFNRIDKLYNGTNVAICGYHGDWYAVVYSNRGNDLEACNTFTPWRKTMPYTGPCRSGWVHKHWIGNLAG
jgi:hypothetical protein